MIKNDAALNCTNNLLFPLNDRFDLAIQLSELKIAYEIASESEVGVHIEVVLLFACRFVSSPTRAQHLFLLPNCRAVYF